MDWLITKIIEWWQQPRITAKLEVILTFVAAISLLIAGAVKTYRFFASCVRRYLDWRSRWPLEGLTAGEPLPTPQFTGREDERKLLTALIDNHHVCAVEGPPLIGKSWLISEVLKSGGMAGRCIFIEVKRKRGLSALLFAINAGLVRLGCLDFDGVCRRDDLTGEQKVQELRPLLVAGNWVIVLDAYERVEAGGEIDQIIESCSKGIGQTRVVLGTRRNPSWLPEAAVVNMPAMPAEQMNTLCCKLGLTKAEADEVCGKLAGLPGAAGVFRGVLEQKGPAAARQLVGKKPEKLGRTLFEAAFKAAPSSARDVWMVASWFPQPLMRHAAFVICGEDIFEEGVSLLERWTVLTEGSERLDLHAWATRTGKTALRWIALPWHADRRRVWGQQAARFYAAFAEEKAEDRDAVEAELENLLAAARLAFRNQEWAALWAMAYALDDPLDRYGRWLAQRELLDLCIEGARRANKPERGADFFHNRGVAAQNQGRLDEAEALYERSLALERVLGREHKAAETLHHLGTVARQRKQLKRAQHLYRQSLEVSRQQRNRPWEARTLAELAVLAGELGQPDECETLLLEVLVIFRDLRMAREEGQTLHQLGLVEETRGHLEKANQFYQQALNVYAGISDRPHEGLTRAQMALLAEKQGNLRLAVERMEQAYHLLAGMGHSASEQAKGDLARLRRRLEQEGGADD